MDVQGRAYARSLAELDGRLDRIQLDLEQLSRELAAAEERLNEGAPRIAQPAREPPAEPPVPVEQPAGAHLLFVPRPSGYGLLAQPGPVPAPGTEVELPELGRTFVVAKLGPAPLPGDARTCAYLLG